MSVPLEIFEPALDVEPEAEPSDEPDADLDGVSDAADDGDAPVVVKRKTRRGSRGGKNRRKKPVAADGAAAEETDEVGSGVATVVAQSDELVADEELETENGAPELDAPVLTVRRGRRRNRFSCRRRYGCRSGSGRARHSRRGGTRLRADVRVARRFRPQMMAPFRYTPSACGRLPAFSAPETTLA